MSSTKQCVKGHIYDGKMYQFCPYCNNDGSSGAIPIGGDFPSTIGTPQEMPSVNGGNNDFPPTRPVNDGNNNFPPTIPVNGDNNISDGVAKKNISDKMSKTIAITPIDEDNGSSGATDNAAVTRSEEFINPVCGWLVAVNGEKTGLSFPIHSERNYIGRGDSFDVNLYFDGSVSSNGDAVISFDSRGKKFHITVGAGKNNVYVNDEILLAPTVMNDYDRIQIGKTTFVFRSFCGEQFMY